MTFTTDTLDLRVQDIDVRLAYLRRPGPNAPIVCLHGFGSTKEDYADLAQRPDFDGHDLVFWDAPGCGASDLSDPDALSIPFLVAVVRRACAALGLDRFVLAGHSMGGLTGLMFAHAHPDQVLGFMSIEGNVAPEDCFLSRQIIEFPAATPDAFMQDFMARMRDRQEYASALYAVALPLKVRPTTFRPVFSSMVEISDTAPLMQYLSDMPCPRAFVYGAQNRHLSYLAHLPQIGVEVIEIPHAGHFPMYSNPPALWAAMAAFTQRVTHT